MKLKEALIKYREAVVFPTLGAVTSCRQTINHDFYCSLLTAYYSLLTRPLTNMKKHNLNNMRNHQHQHYRG